MTTPPITEAPVTTIDHLDHDTPCQIVHTISGPCEDPADWWFIAQHHCVPDQTLSRFTCHTHLAYVRAGGQAMCGTCRRPYIILPTIIRTEPIR